LKNRIAEYITENGLGAFKKQCYLHAKAYTHSCILDSCQLNTGVNGGKYELMVAFGAINTFTSIIDLQKATDNGKWLFGVLGYDLKNQFEKLSSSNTPIVETEELVFFEPRTLLTIEKNGNINLVGEVLPDSFWQDQEHTVQPQISQDLSPTKKEEYISKIKEIQELIREGDVYELNYCVPYTHTFESFSPTQFQLDLLQASPVPMASYLKTGHIHLCGASMERYLLKEDNKLISQPIKGTIRKGTSPQEDELLIAELENSEKDRAENVMIVDLVRNDLNRICKRGSVQVPEIFGIYSYLQVHQMISTVEGILQDGNTFSDVLSATFPMGSMTGAPKIAAMQHIESLENFKRGWYSGAVGYIAPNRDFDFNVVIRSVICDMNKKVLNYNAGGAITIDSDPESEWKEVKLKTKAITQVLGL